MRRALKIGVGLVVVIGVGLVMLEFINDGASRWHPEKPNTPMVFNGIALTVVSAAISETIDPILLDYGSPDFEGPHVQVILGVDNVSNQGNVDFPVSMQLVDGQGRRTWPVRGCGHTPYQVGGSGACLALFEIVRGETDFKLALSHYVFGRPICRDSRKEENLRNRLALSACRLINERWVDIELD